MKIIVKAGRAADNFFDRKAVVRALGRQRARVYAEFGRRVRKSALKSIPYKEGVSTPGSPPHTHRSRPLTRRSRSTGKTRRRMVSLLREFTYYKYDRSTSSVIIGPERLHRTLDPRSLPALEYGGRSTVRSKRGGKTGLRQVSIRPRPWITPAGKSHLKDLPPLWKQSGILP